jgi:superfamily I DNA/RNA helicase
MPIAPAPAGWDSAGRVKSTWRSGCCSRSVGRGQCSPDYLIDFQERVGRAVETHILRTNYRCPQNVVEMGNRLIAHNTNRIDTNQVAHRADVADVKLWHCLNSASEAQVIARLIKQLYADRSAKGFNYSDLAVLRRINSQSLPPQIALALEEIPYHWGPGREGR